MDRLVQAYSIDRYNQLPGLGDAHSAFQERGGQKLLLDTFHKLFLRHGVTDLVGPALAHRHFRLSEDELLVDVNGTSTIWKLPSEALPLVGNSYRKHGGLIRPSSWMVQGESLVPYEFFFGKARDGENGDVLRRLSPTFLGEFVRMVKDHNLGGVLGLNVVQGIENCRLEFTEGRSNITTPVSEDELRQLGSDCLMVGYKYGRRAGEMRVMLACHNVPIPGPSHVS